MTCSTPLPAPCAPATRAAIAPFVVANGLDPAQRVAIYANNVRENALATLEAGFPVLLRLAGRDWFRQTGIGYLRRHPSPSGNLHYLGARLPEYLEAELADGPYAYFADVARLEWAYQEVLVAAEPPELDLAALAAIPPERHLDLVLEMNPASRLVGSVWPLLAIWRANQPGDDSHGTVSLDAGACRLLVIRRDDHVELRELPPGEFAFLKADHGCQEHRRCRGRRAGGRSGLRARRRAAAPRPAGRPHGLPSA